MSSTRKEAPPIGDRTPLQVLIVEDDEDTARVFALILEESGHACRVARTASAALTAIEERRPDVAIIDLGLPRVSGLELASDIRAALGSHVRLVAVSGYSDGHVRQRAVAGFDAFLPKPIAMPTLLDEVARERE